MRLRPIAILGWTGLLVVAAGFGSGAMLERLEPPPLPGEPSPPASSTDVSDWASRQALLGAYVVDAYGESASLVATCGGPRRDEAADEIRLRYLDAWMRDAFDVRLESRDETALATWRRLALPVPPEPPPLDRTKARIAVDEATTATVHPGIETDDHYLITSTTRRDVDAAAWARALTAVREPAYTQLPAGVGTAGADGFVVEIESCLGGRYHLVKRWSPGNSPGDADFLHAVRVVHQAAGAAIALPGWLDENGRVIL